MGNLVSMKGGNSCGGFEVLRFVSAVVVVFDVAAKQRGCLLFFLSLSLFLGVAKVVHSVGQLGASSRPGGKVCLPGNWRQTLCVHATHFSLFPPSFSATPSALTAVRSNQLQQH